MIWLSFLILTSSILLDPNYNIDNGTFSPIFMVLTSGARNMETTTFLGLVASISGLVLYFTSGAFSLISDLIGMIFLSMGIVLIYIGVALILWSVLGSINIFFESIGRRG
jgi:hypothetical protein